MVCNGFTAIGAEWFAKWQSKQWNAQNSAIWISMIMLASGIYVFLGNDGEVEGLRPGPAA